MNSLYPLKFAPVFKEKIWGGQKIRTSLGLDFTPLPNCGEAWVLSGVPGSETTVANGFLKGNTLNELVEIYMDDLLGEKVFDEHPDEFPLLIKFIDSNEWLSIQVHPDDTLAKKRGLSNGKSEMWYVLEAEKEAEIIAGFRKKADRKSYIDHLQKKRLGDILNREKVSKGDLFYMPAGRVHALGPGILLAEIQQTSDVTYRIYDFDRVDDRGNPRELHTELALDAIDFTVHDHYRTRYKALPNLPAPLVHTPHFNADLLTIDRPIDRDHTILDSFVIHLCVDGAYRIDFEGGTETVRKGDAVLIPAISGEIRMSPENTASFMEIYIL